MNPRDAVFVATGPGTPGGRYLRRFWQPVWVSRELAPGRAMPIRVLGQDFTLYRGDSGSVHVVAPRCPHRGMQLSAGAISGDELECPYHGWRFAHDGRCVRQPAEPDPFCDKVKIATYPAREAMGLVFAYFGDEPAPELPRWPELETGGWVMRHRIDANYFQSAENIVDDVHVQYVHRDAAYRDTRYKGMPRVSAEETSFGLTQRLLHDGGIEKLIHFIMPNICYLKSGFLGRQEFKMVFYYVPIDDVSHNHFVTTDMPELPASVRPEFENLSPLAKDAWFSRTTSDVLAGVRRLAEFVPPQHYFRLQDSVMVVGQGAIQDRSTERLGASDAAVILLRKLWRREVKLLEERRPLTFAVPAELDRLGTREPRSGGEVE